MNKRVGPLVGNHAAVADELLPLDTPTAPQPNGADERTPEQTTTLLMAAAKDFDENFPDGAIDDVGSNIPRQYGILVCALPGGAVEVRQEGQHHDFQSEETDKIEILPRNIVAFVLKILLATGFRNVNLTENTGYDDEPLKDGSQPSDFDYRPEPPPGPPASPATIIRPAPPIIAPDPEPDNGVAFQWGDDATILQEQRQTAVYFNPHRDLVVRQECPGENDALVFIQARNIPDFIDRLTTTAKAGP